AIRQITAMMERVLEHHEPLSRELADRAVEALERIAVLLPQLEANLGTRRAAPLAGDLYECVRYYPKWRYQSLVLRRVIELYVTLRGQLSDLVREVGFVRQRLGELQEAFGNAA